MGCRFSEPQTADEPLSKVEGMVLNTTQYDIDDQINQQQELDKQTESEKIKLLLLGTGESGKSTIFKQMRILHGTAKTDDDLRMYGVIVRSNAVVAVRKLCSLLRKLGLESKLDEESSNGVAQDSSMTLREAYDQIIAYLVDNTKTCEATVPENDWVGRSPRAGNAANHDASQFFFHVDAFKVFWESIIAKEVWLQRAQTNINDSHSEYLSELQRIASPDYIPTEHDILISRVRTTQINVEKYEIDGAEFEIYDVGGQRSERRKWVECFENVHAVIFVAALSEYDQNLAEAKRQNRMKEALSLFESVVKNVHFAETSIMLFLNKKDIFAEKIQYSDIAATSHFSDYAGPPKDFDHGVLYFIQKFEENLEEEEFNDSFIHVTCATDTTNMEFVLDSTRTMIMKENMKRAGFF